MQKICFKGFNSKGVAVLLCLLMTIFLITGCSGTKQETSTPDATNSTTRVITDMAGRQVEIPTTINTIYCAVPTAEAMVCSLAPEKMVAWVFEQPDAGKKYLSDPVKELPVLGGWMGEKCTANLEEIAKVAPDLIVFMTTLSPNYDYALKNAESITNQTNRPVVIMDSSFENTAKVYKLMGDILGHQERAEELSAYCEKAMNDIKEMTSKIPQDKLVRVYYAEGAGGLATDPSGSGHTEVLDFVRGVNVADVQAKGGQGMTPVSLEQVLSWNPDVILVSTSTGGEKNYQSILKDASWNNVKAVKDGKVYLTPSLPFNWFDRPPDIMRIIGIKWLANVLYPEYVNIDLNQEVKDFFKLFYNMDLNDEQVAELLKNAI